MLYEVFSLFWSTDYSFKIWPSISGVTFCSWYSCLNIQVFCNVTPCRQVNTVTDVSKGSNDFTFSTKLFKKSNGADMNLQQHRCENLKARTFLSLRAGPSLMLLCQFSCYTKHFIFKGTSTWFTDMSPSRMALSREGIGQEVPCAQIEWP
jgi:hypothetical protein